MSLTQVEKGVPGWPATCFLLSAWHSRPYSLPLAVPFVEVPLPAVRVWPGAFCELPFPGPCAKATAGTTPRITAAAVAAILEWVLLNVLPPVCGINRARGFRTRLLLSKV
jgi:hypothetical protein